METVELRAFVAAARTGTFVDAAAALNLTTAPVSRAVKRLEQQVGAELLRRDYHRLVPTEVGERVLPDAVTALVRMRAMEAAGTGAPPLRVGATPWAPDRFVSSFLDRVADAGGAEPIVRQPTVALMRLLAYGDLDLALVHQPDAAPGVTTRTLARYRTTFLATPDHPLAQHDHVSIESLARVPLAIATGSHRRLALAGIFRQLHEYGITRVIHIPTADWATLPATMRELGAVTIGSINQTTPMLQVTARNGLVPLHLDGGEHVHLELDLAWRASDDWPGSPVSHVVTEMRPAPGEPPEVLS